MNKRTGLSLIRFARREYPDNKELISQEKNKYTVVVKETRKSWCNSDPCAGTYAFENTGDYVFEIVKAGSGWKIDKYFMQNQQNNVNRPKYDALMF